MNNPRSEYYINDSDKNCIFIMHTPTGSVAELSVWSNLSTLPLDLNYVPENGALWFNRLHSNMPGMGIGSDLLDLVIEYCNEYRYLLLCEASAYGNLSQDQLIAFYKRHGLENLIPDAPEALVYYPI